MAVPIPQMTLKLHLHDMQAAISRAFSEHQLLETEEFNRALAAAIQSVDLEAILREQVRQALTEVVRDGVRRAAQDAVWEVLREGDTKTFWADAMRKALHELTRTP